MKKSSKRIVALAGVILLAALYLLLLFSALFDFPYADRIFQASLFATIAVPLLIWIYVWLYEKTVERYHRDREENQKTE